MVWKWASLVPDALQRSTVIRNDDMSPFWVIHSHSMVIYVWIYENGTKLRGKSVFFSFPFSLSSSHSPPFSIFRPLTWLEEGLEVYRNQGEIRVCGVQFIFINPDIYGWHGFADRPGLCPPLKLYYCYIFLVKMPIIFLLVTLFSYRLS